MRTQQLRTFSSHVDLSRLDTETHKVFNKKAYLFLCREQLSSQLSKDGGREQHEKDRTVEKDLHDRQFRSWFFRIKGI